MTFGGSEVTVVEVADGAVTVRTPPAPVGPVDVVVSTVAGPSAPLTYTYVPTISGLTPHVGPTRGGQLVTITGSGFGTPDPAASSARVRSARVMAHATRTPPPVTFNGLPAMEVTVNADGTQLTLRTPANAVGPADIVVGYPGAQAIFHALYTYVGPAVPVSTPAPTTPGTAAPTAPPVAPDTADGAQVVPGRAGGALPFTGLDVVALVSAGSLLTVGGALMLVVGRRRRGA